MIPGDRQMKGVAGPKSGFKAAKIFLRETEIVRIRQNDRKGLLHDDLKFGIGARRRVGIQLTNANLSGEQRGELDPGPMADRELRRRGASWWQGKPAVCTMSGLPALATG